ncbi:TonB-dependent receptor plug domain-containing protein [Leptospira ilyithenensis]|uniref:TonB-dependent receptor n=1 Tax=Leptospira ilyithenensis TaxID=2484901 RepID=A0A4R9LT21_9LEPT|nr:TonB-dependent receptor plug domain-containing protein [Leptospira ilyithenensis]TGN13129.1 TonB-dependent receptor [Leptospira ilyithenensis]
MNSANNKLNKYIILIFTFMLMGSPLLAVSVKIKLYNQKKEEGEKNLSIMVFETKKFFQTDGEGNVTLEFPAPGEYTLRLLRDTGMQEMKLSVGATDEERTVYTEKKVVPKGGIVVEGEREKTVSSRTKVRYEEIKRMPGTFGEALRSLETLPGVIPNIGFGGGANGIIIRGADPQSNTYLYDDLPILYPYHLDGLTSVIHNDLIKSIDLYRGAFPANFNNATGGVIEIETVDTIQKAKGAFQVSLWNTTAYSATPFANGKGYVAIAGKLGYLDKTLGASGLLPEGIRLPRYNDSQIKLVYNFTPEHQVALYNLTAQDNFAIDIPNKAVNDPTKDPISTFSGARANFGQSFRTTALRYTWVPGDKFQNRITLINFDPITQYNVGVGSIQGKQYVRPTYVGVRQDANWQATDFLKIDFGSEYRRLSFRDYGDQVKLKDPTNVSPNPYNTADPDFISQPLSVKGLSGYYNGYTTLHFKFGNFLIEPGVRYDHLEITNNGALAPRATASYTFPEIGKGLTIFGSGGDLARFPQTTVFNKETGNPDLRFEKVRKVSAGFEQKFNSVWQVTFEAFKNEFRDTIVSDPYISTPLGMNPDKSRLLAQPLVTNRSLNYSNRQNGWSHGYEVMIRKNSKPGIRDWFGWISYTWSQSFVNDNINKTYDGDNFQYSTIEKKVIAEYFPNSKEQLATWDRTHVVNVIYGWRFTEEYQIGGRWSYLTSVPYQPITGDDGGRYSNPLNGLTYWNPTYSNNPYSSDYGNVKRGADYHRLDVRIDKFENYSWGYVNWYVEIVNLYLRKNTNGEGFDNSRPFSATNPTPSQTFGTLELPGGTVIPFFNIGMEVHF